LNATFGKSHLHWPVAGGDACLSCHNPHASNEDMLLLASSNELCGSCHPDSTAGLGEQASLHEPVEAGDCSTCHEPHSSDNVFLMQTATVNDLCGSCHEWRRHSSHPLGENVFDQRNANLTLDCSSCHDPHGSQFKAMSHLDPTGDLCVSCHEQVAR
jgi:predicted CXXCH cytochrome family protein